VNPRAAYVGVGANLGDARAAVTKAMDALSEFGTVAVRSSLYRTRPWGVVDQPDFINAVALLHTALPPGDLLRALKQLEQRLGRTPAPRWGPRAIDLDLLWYGDLTLSEPGLQLPHPELSRRAFVLVPLAEIDPRFEPMRSALPAAELAGVVRLE
jgi:2-amino-4-hydroxy-6-hydroxymethyldihydropteridine diphosphokinase